MRSGWIVPCRDHANQRRVIYGWNPEIGDPTVYGWLTVLAYALAAWWCGRAAQVGPKTERRFWFVLCGIMAFLCVNKELDLQTLLTDVGRHVARSQGWYDRRREYQLFFIVALGVVALVTTITLLTLLRRARWPVLGGVVGLAALLLFVLVRASSFEKMDRFINGHVRGWKMNHIMEIGGIAIVAACALAARRGTGRKRRR